MLPVGERVGGVTRKIWRTSDIEQAFASYIYATTAAGGAIDMAAIGSLCLSFGIDIERVAVPVRKVRKVTGK